MSKYTITYTEELSIWASKDIDVDPQDFLDCRTEEEVLDKLDIYLMEAADFRLEYYWDSCDGTHDWKCPEEFLIEWRKLKGLNEKS